MSFDQLGLMPGLLKAVSEKGYTVPTPIQEKAIPMILDGKDVMGGAQTGTGKTAAFALPVLQTIYERGRGDRRPRVLVLAPTRELAAQVHESFEDYGRNLPMKSTVVFGGVNINPQIDKLKRGVDILVACPGRLLDHAGQRTVDLSGVEILILDEADRMLDMGFIHDIRRVLKLLPEDRQTLLFSATYSKDIRDLASRTLKDPQMIEVPRKTMTADNVQQVVHPVSKNQKRHLLAHLIKEGDWSRVLVFARMKHMANRLAGQLEKEGINAAAIHGNKSQSARTKALAGFKSGEIRVLVATDIAARGLDIDQLPHVVNFELPNVPEDYVHRIGRTGRAGASGEAVSLVTQEEQPLLHGVERLLKLEIRREEIAGFEVDFTLAAPNSFKDSARPPKKARDEREKSAQNFKFQKRRRRGGGGRKPGGNSGPNPGARA